MIVIITGASHSGKNKQYYLVVTDDNTGLEQFRHPVIVDITFAEDFGF